MVLLQALQTTEKQLNISPPLQVPITLSAHKTDLWLERRGQEDMR